MLLIVVVGATRRCWHCYSLLVVVLHLSRLAAAAAVAFSVDLAT